MGERVGIAADKNAYGFCFVNEINSFKLFEISLTQEIMGNKAFEI